MDNKEEWAGLSCIGAIHSEFKSKKGKSDEWHYYISSRKLTAEELLDIDEKRMGCRNHALVIRCSFQRRLLPTFR